MYNIDNTSRIDNDNNDEDVYYRNKGISLNDNNDDRKATGKKQQWKKQSKLEWWQQQQQKNKKQKQKQNRPVNVHMVADSI